MKFAPIVTLALLSISGLNAQTEINFFGSAFNETVSIGGPIFIELIINQDGSVSGYLDADPYPGGQNLCGAGNISGLIDENRILTFSYVSNDPDADCSQIDGTLFEYTCTLNSDFTSLSGRFISILGNQNSTGYVTLRAEKNCPDIAHLENMYANVIGTKDELYTRQFLCLAEKTCEDLSFNGEDSWSNGFVRYLFDYLSTHNVSSSALEFRCFSLEPKELCFARTGKYHVERDLAPAFFSYCDQVRSEEDINSWTISHELFLENAVDECFDELIISDDVCTLFPNTSCAVFLEISRNFTKVAARSLRKAAQAYCRYDNDLISIEEMNDELLSLSSDSQPFPDIDSLSQFKVSIPTDRLIVGESYQVITGSYSGLIESRSAEKYYIDVPESIASINNTGLLTVNGTVSPIVTILTPITVYVFRNDSIGIGQFLIQDNDNDNDLLADSHEISVGSSQSVPNSPLYDFDRDGINDFFEVLIQTNPNIADTDTDGYSDSWEFVVRSDPLDANISPATNLVISNDKSILSNNSVKIHPNPFNSELTISSNSANTLEVRSVKCYDFQGKEVLNYNDSDDRNIQLPITLELPNNLIPGMYFLRINYGNKVGVFKVVKD